MVYNFRNLLKWSSLILFSFSSPILAANGHIYLSGTLGASNAKLSNSDPQITYYDDLLTDAYPLSNSHESTAIVGLSGGYEFAGAGTVPAIALGLGVYGTPKKYDYRGQVIETAAGDSSSVLYDYKFHLRSVRAMAEAQFTWLLRQLTPFINMGVGPAWNRLSGYTETPIDSTGYVPVPPFQSHTNTHFAYQVGFGVGYAFNFSDHASCQERISLGYRYVDLGDVSFGTRGDVYPYPLDIGKLRMNEVYLTYTHLF